MIKNISLKTAVSLFLNNIHFQEICEKVEKKE